MLFAAFCLFFVVFVMHIFQLVTVSNAKLKQLRFIATRTQVALHVLENLGFNRLYGHSRHDHGRGTQLEEAVLATPSGVEVLASDSFLDPRTPLQRAQLVGALMYVCLYGLYRFMLLVFWWM